MATTLAGSWMLAIFTVMGNQVLVGANGPIMSNCKLA
jgi:hypothetical protein